MARVVWRQVCVITGRGESDSVQVSVCVCVWVRGQVLPRTEPMLGTPRMHDVLAVLCCEHRSGQRGVRVREGIGHTHTHRQGPQASICTFSQGLAMRCATPRQQGPAHASRHTGRAPV